jgi:glycosyltransferase involved in cell wall biosynthesis
VKLLVVGWDIPATTAMPGSPRLFNLCQGLSRSHELHLVTRCSSRERHQWFLDDSAARGVFESITILPEPPASATWWNKQRHRLHQAAYFDSKYLYPRYHDEVRETIGALADRYQVDVVYVDGLVMSSYVESTPRRLAFIDLHDSLTLLFTRMMKAEHDLKKKFKLYLQARDAARSERALADRFSLILTNSPVDETALKNLSPAARTLTIPNGVDTDFFRPNGGRVQPKRLVFTGVLGYGPNEDSVLHFCEAIVPLVRERVPGAEFWIVGSEPTARVRALVQHAGVHVTGGVPDVRPYLESAAVFVCPLRSGAGVKNKILAALAMGKAVVATRLSLDGLDLKEEHDLLAADDPEDFSDKVVRLLADPARRDELGQHGQRSVRQRHSWQVSAEILDDALRRLAR